MISASNRHVAAYTNYFSRVNSLASRRHFTTVVTLREHRELQYHSTMQRMFGYVTNWPMVRSLC